MTIRAVGVRSASVGKQSNAAHHRTKPDRALQPVDIWRSRRTRASAGSRRWDWHGQQPCPHGSPSALVTPSGPLVARIRARRCRPAAERRSPGSPHGCPSGAGSRSFRHGSPARRRRPAVQRHLSSKCGMLANVRCRSFVASLQFSVRNRSSLASRNNEGESFWIPAHDTGRQAAPSPCKAGVIFFTMIYFDDAVGARDSTAKTAACCAVPMRRWCTGT